MRAAANFRMSQMSRTLIAREPRTAEAEAETEVTAVIEVETAVAVEVVPVEAAVGGVDAAGVTVAVAGATVAAVMADTVEAAEAGTRVSLTQIARLEGLHTWLQPFSFALASA